MAQLIIKQVVYLDSDLDVVIDNDATIAVDKIEKDLSAKGLMLSGAWEVKLYEQYGCPETRTFVKTSDLNSGKWVHDVERQEYEDNEGPYALDSIEYIDASEFQIALDAHKANGL